VSPGDVYQLEEDTPEMPANKRQVEPNLSTLMIIHIVASPLMYNAISCIVDLSWTLTSRRSSSGSLITSAALNSYIMSGTTLSPASPSTLTSASLTSMQNCLVQVCRFVFPHQAHELDASGNYTTTMCFLHVSLHHTSKHYF